MAKISLTTETAESIRTKLVTARGGVAELKAVVEMLPMTKREYTRIQTLTKKMTDAIEMVEDAVEEAVNAPVTKTEVRAALKDATPEQVAAIAAILAPKAESKPEEEQEAEPDHVEEPAPEDYLGDE